MLTLAIHLFEPFFKHRPGSLKYNVTLGLAIGASLFTRFYGRRIIREQFGPLGGRNLELTGKQVLYVTLFVISIGVYGAWLMF
jgi:hypothetical protein